MVSSLLVRGGAIAEPGGRRAADIRCEGGRMVAIGESLEPDGALVLDARGLTIGPGFIDVHVHGGGGHSFFQPDAETVRAYARWAPGNGVTSFLVSTVGRDDLMTEAILRALRPGIGAGDGAEALGFHLEGPFINPARKGAFPTRYLRPPVLQELARYQDASGGALRQMTIAPERAGALAAIGQLIDAGSVAAIGHTDASFEQAQAGFGAGATHVTHLFNAMRPLHQRDGGPIAAALLESRATCELICDGAHVAPEMLRVAYGLLGPNRTVVITDNLEIAGMPATSGAFGGEAVRVEGNAAVRSDGTIVGSVATMDQHFRNAVTFLGIDLATAFRLCSTNPAVVAGAASRKGAIRRGADADLVLLDESLMVAATICGGSVAYARDAGRMGALEA